MSVNIRDGKAVMLDRRSSREPAQEVTPEQIGDAPRMARLLMGILRDLASLKRRWWPKRIDFEGVELDATGTEIIRLDHGLGGPVRYWVVGGWDGATAPCLREDPASTADTLLLTSTVAGIATIRVEESG